MAAAHKIRVDAVLAEVDDIFAVKEEQKQVTEGVFSVHTFWL